MKKIGIICAGDSELEPFLKRLNQTAIMEKAMLSFHEGTIDGLPVTVLYSCVSPHPLLFGDIATGEQFVAESERERIRRRLSPLAADMETAAIAHVCYVNQIPFLSVRTITDTAAHDGIDSFEQNCAKASEIAADVTMGILKQAVCCWK